MNLVSSIIKYIKSRNLTSTDYFNYRFIPGFILSCMFIMSYKQYVTKPILCYTSTNINGIGVSDYIQNMCYLSDKFSVNKVSDKFNWKMRSNIYMWFPIILLIQTLSFCISNLFWNYFGGDYLIEICLEDDNNSNYVPSEKISMVIRRMQKYYSDKIITFQLITAYLISNLITILICIFNLLLLWSLMFEKDYKYPINIKKNIFLFDSITEHNSVFQSIVFCKVILMHLGNTNTYTSQCILTGNILYEKIFSMIYCLLIISIAVTIINIIKWIIIYIIKNIFYLDT